MTRHEPDKYGWTDDDLASAIAQAARVLSVEDIFEAGFAYGQNSGRRRHDVPFREWLESRLEQRRYVRR